MASIELFMQWAGDGIRHNDGTEDYELWSGELFIFDTVLRTVSTERRSQNVYLTPVQDTPPADFSRDPTELLTTYVSGPTQFRYFHDGYGGVTIENNTLTIGSLVTGSTCFGGRNGSIALQITGPPGPYTYLWDDGPTTRDRGPVPAGAYRVRVQDGPTGTIARATIQVGANPELQVLIQKNGADVRLVVSGGTAPYTYLWHDGATTADRVNLPDGPASCRITDALGCTTDVALVVNRALFYWSRNPITLALDAGAAYRADPTTKPGLTFLCEVWVELEYLSGAFTQVGGVLEQPADRAGRTTFEVQALLDGFLAPHVPPPGATGVQRADPLFRRFYLKYAESFGAPPVRAGTTVLTQSYVLLGGLNAYESRQRTFAEAYLPTVKPFLTWEPPVKAVLPDQPEFLYYLVQEALDGFRFQVRVQYTDGTSETLNLGGVDAVRRHEVYCRPVGYQALRLAALAGPRRVRAWEVWVTSVDEATVLSETRRYELDERPFPRRRYLLFATSLGGMATYAATGEALHEAELTGEEAARPLRPDDDPLQGDVRVQARQLRPVVRLASGPRTRAQVEAAQDLLLSRRVLLLSRDGRRWLPGYLKAKTTPLLDESKAVPTQDLDFYLLAEQLYTPTLGPAQVTYAHPAL